MHAYTQVQPRHKCKMTHLTSFDIFDLEEKSDKKMVDIGPVHVKMDD